MDTKLVPRKRGPPSKPVTRGRPAAKRIIEEDDEDEYLEADEQIADPDEGDDLEADVEPEDEDDESEYGVRGGSRRKTKATRKTRGSARGSKKTQGITITRGSASRGRSKSAPKKKAADAEDDEEFINDGEIEEGASDHEEEEGSGGSEDDGTVEKSGAKGEETVFIDNLPNDEFAIRAMLKEVKK